MPGHCFYSFCDTILINSDVSGSFPITAINLPRSVFLLYGNVEESTGLSKTILAKLAIDKAGLFPRFWISSVGILTASQVTCWCTFRTVSNRLTNESLVHGMRE